jgi:hypothetical protein
MSKENEKRRDGSMDLWPGRRDGERWASALGTGILPLSKSGMSESGAEKMGFFCRFDRQVPRKPALEGRIKGHNIEGNYLTGKSSPLGRGASLPPRRGSRRDERQVLDAQRAGLEEEREWRRLKSSIWQEK